MEQGADYARILEAPIVFATDGVFCKSLHAKFNKPLLLNQQEVDEFIREIIALKFLHDYKVNTISKEVLWGRQELIKIFGEANNLLRGEGLRAGIDRFGEFANILFLKLISEVADDREVNGEVSELDVDCRWNFIKNLPPPSRIDYINKTVYERLNALYKTEIFTPLQMRNPSVFREIMEKLDPLKLNDVDSDIKGDAFEYFLKESTASGNDLGEYFTPRHIVKTMVRIANPQIGEKVYDPFCGTGGLLIESFRHIWNSMPRTPSTTKQLRAKTIFGNEITNTARIAKMNMILAGDGHNNIKMQDSFAAPVEDKYDVVLTNIPYSQKTKFSNLYEIPSNNGDSICVQHCIRAINGLAENGRMALVVPEGFLFRKDLAKTREFLLDRCNLRSVISLPQGVFLPYTGVKTNIIYCDKVKHKDRKKVASKHYWYFEVKNDGYTLDSRRSKIEGVNDLEIYQEYRNPDEECKDDMLKVGFTAVSFDKIKDSDFTLVGSKYRKIEYENSKFDMVSLNNLVANGLLVIQKGKSITKEKRREGNIPVIAGGRTSPYNHNESTHQGNVITISASGTAGFVWYHCSPIWASDCNVLFSNDDGKLETKFLYYVLKNRQEDVYKLQHGAVQPHVYAEDLKTLQIPLPPLAEQKKLVAELDKIQDSIKAAETLIKNLKTAGADILKNFLANFYEEGGQVLKIDEIASFNPGIKEKFSDNYEVSFVPMANINEHDPEFEVNTVRPFSEVKKGFTYFEDGDVLLAKITPCFENGKAGVACNLKNGVGFGSTEYIVIRANNEKTRPEWIYYFLNMQEFLEVGANNMTGSGGQRRVPLDLIKNYKIPVPKLEDQDIVLAQITEQRKLIAPLPLLALNLRSQMQSKINALCAGNQVNFQSHS
ncbi:MAG: N-6 DNA methylase [Tannerellaceae bacterium]|nr:N-6 DNA methylase [Tannerellaceae bacterium]